MFIKFSGLKRHSLIFVLLAIALPVRAAWFSETQGIMGTEVSVTVWHEDAKHAQAAIDAVMAEMRRIDQAFSPYKPESELSRINRDAGKSPQTLSDELTLLIDKSLAVSALSSGAFDITYASIGHVYDYRNGVQPNEAQRESLKPAINYRWLKFDKAHKSLFFDHKNVQIDLGGIAKGHAIDKAAAILNEFGISHASVSAGGDSRLLGDRRGRPWVVGIKHPRQESDKNEAVIRLPLSDTAISTSGDYERYFIDGISGERIHHIINPRTGKSASEVMSVTVIGEQGLDTDPLSTALFVLGVERGLALINSLPSFDAIIIDTNGKVFFSDGLDPG